MSFGGLFEVGVGGAGGLPERLGGGVSDGLVVWFGLVGGLPCSAFLFGLALGCYMSFNVKWNYTAEMRWSFEDASA